MDEEYFIFQIIEKYLKELGIKGKNMGLGSYKFKDK